MTRRHPARISCAVVGLAAAGGLALTMPASLAAAPATPTLTNVVPESAAISLRAKIVSIDPASRRVVLEAPSGAEMPVTAGPVVRLNLLKPGDTVSVKYYRSVAFMIAAPRSAGGAMAPQSSESALLARPARTPGGVALRVTKVSGLVVGIDLAAHSVDVVDPKGGGLYTIDVTDPARIARLPELKVGDTITAVINEAMAVSITPAPAAYFPPTAARRR